ncbi:MAG: CDP-alcohol phosphatidyltransferase family protein [Anaerolineae bacterium]|jgi:phosphatidylglycerophosphate synthase|nr:CDP-alcohol phosphatidyltransferase family protein [Anaerolineae bacterium]
MPEQKTAAEKANPQRIINTLFGKPEMRFVRWFESIAPDWVSPDLMTLIGVLGSVLILVGYILTGMHPAFLWLASFGFFLNWFGDSLDGNLARIRHIERPRYGYFVDHTVDVVSMVFIFVGLGITPFVDMNYALYTLVAYLMMNIFVYIDTQVNEKFQISYAKLGPTEGRILFVVSNTVMYFVGYQTVTLFNTVFTIYDLYFIFWALFLLGIFLVSVISGSVKLYAEEPPVKYVRPKHE